MSLLHQVCILLVAAVLAVPLFRRLKLGAVLGYLAAGLLIGPWGLRLIADVESILHFSEFGVVLLLFLIGLELNPSRLWIMRRAVFGLGGAQVVGTSLCLGGLGIALGAPPVAALVAGFGLALSSTAFVLPILAEKNQLATPHGNAAFAILLFQDLAVIPLLVILPMLAVSGQSAVQQSGVVMAAQIIGALVGLVLAGRFLLRPIFKLIAASGNQEIMTALALLVVVGTASIMHFVGLSMSLGAFLAGVLLAESEYRHELQADIEPFKGLLLGLFFMAVGMSANLGIIRDETLRVVAVVVGFMIAKSLVVYGVSRLFGESRDSARSVATSLSQGGEFAFVLFGIASSAKVLSQHSADFLVVAVTVSMILTPLSFLLNERVLTRWFRKEERREFDTISDHENPVVIAGFGRVGQIVGRILRMRKIGFTALDAAPTHVDFLRRFGNMIYYGDATRLDLLRAAHLDKAKVLVVAIDDMVASVKVVELAQQHFPGIKIYARARNRQHAYQLLAMGVNLIIRETFEASLTLSRHVLEGLGIPAQTAKATVEKFASYDEEMVRATYVHRHDEKKLVESAKQYTQELESLFQNDSHNDAGTERESTTSHRSFPPTSQT
ncbi:MAG: cation:proton antiporter [Myxococcales bacterium]|nr:cation:proton antiporter [Myxococcales bacterium]